MKKKRIIIFLITVIVFLGCAKNEAEKREIETVDAIAPESGSFESMSSSEDIETSDTEDIAKLNVTETTFFEALQTIEETKEYEFNLQQFIEYEMDRLESRSLNRYGFGATRGSNIEGFRWYTRALRVDNLGIAVLIQVVNVNENRLERILDIATFQQDSKQVYFGTLWEGDPENQKSQEEDPYRMGVYFYNAPEEVKHGLRIYPDYIIDMLDHKLYIHEPTGEEENFFLFQDPNPV